MHRLKNNPSQTSRRFFNQGVELLYPSIGSDLACASRYTRAKVYKELCPAPFASTVLGVKFYTNIYHNLLDLCLSAL